MKNPRKNASLATIAAHTRNRANRAKKNWLACEDAVKTAPLNESSWRRHMTTRAWRTYHDLATIADHLERLSA